MITLFEKWLTKILDCYPETKHFRNFYLRAMYLLYLFRNLTLNNLRATLKIYLLEYIIFE